MIFFDIEAYSLFLSSLSCPPPALIFNLSLLFIHHFSSVCGARAFYSRVMSSFPNVYDLKRSVASVLHPYQRKATLFGHNTNDVSMDRSEKLEIADFILCVGCRPVWANGTIFIF